jgi:hypothetical protein
LWYRFNLLVSRFVRGERETMRNPFLLGSLIVVLLAFPALSQGPLISHEPVSCVATEGYPIFSAQISGDVATPPRFYFRCDPASSDFYYVEMSQVSPTATGGIYQAILPTPLQPPCNNIVYYLEAVDSAYNPYNTQEASPEVTQGTCEEDKLPPGAPPPSITVFSAGGVQVGAVPGFATTSIVPVAGGASVGGGGIVGNPLFWGLVGASAVTATVVVATTGEEDVSPTTP